MVHVVQMWLTEAPWLGMLEVFIDVTLKGAIFCIAAGLATLILRRSSAFTRNMIWVFALVGLILLPLFSVLSPVWNLPIIPELSSWGTSFYDPETMKPEQEPLVGPAFPAPAGSNDVTARTDNAGPVNLPWYAWGIFAWLAGSALYLCWWLMSHAGVRSIVKQAFTASNEWNELLHGVAEELKLQRHVVLLESRRIKAAITVGIFRPVIVVPSDTKDWTQTRRRLVLSHELAHVKRWDTLVEAFALLVTAVYWFNPLVWHAVRQLRIERERDCDNAVLYTGAKPSDYAELLMTIAADLGVSARPVWRLSTISQSSNLKDRLMNILNQRINRNRGSRRSAMLTGALVLALVLPISTSGLWNAQAGEKSKNDQQAKNEHMKQEQMEKEKMKQKEQAEKEKDTKKVKMSAEEKIQYSWQKICSEGNSAACKVGTIMKKKGPEAGVEAFYKMKNDSDSEYFFKESQFNTLGYLFLYQKNLDEAIAVFELNVKEYPDSWNTYDSLGEAYVVAEKYDKAVKCYETALEMNPDAESSKKALMKLKKHKLQS